MNLIDLAIIAVFAAGFALGWYKGFLSSAFNFASNVLSYLIALIFYGGLASFIIKKTSFGNTLLYFTAGAEKLSDMSVANTDISELGSERISSIITSSDLPKPIENMIMDNITNASFSSQGISTLSDYFNQTIINLSLSLISFLLIFCFIKIICSFALGLYNYVNKFPALKKRDSLFGGCVGILNGAVFVCVVFSIVPIAMSVVLPLDGINELIQNSFFGRMFCNGNIIFNILSSV